MLSSIFISYSFSCDLVIIYWLVSDVLKLYFAIIPICVMVSIYIFRMIAVLIVFLVFKKK